MRLSVCPGESLRLCTSCARNADNQRAPTGPDYRTWIQPYTRGERCFDWYSLPPTPKPATPADQPGEA
jgi:hypothetical protein